MCVVRVRVLGVNEVERDVFENECCSKVELSCVAPAQHKSCDLSRSECRAKTFDITRVDFKVWVTETRANMLRLDHCTVF